MWIAIIILAVVWGGLLIPIVQERRAWIVCAHGGTGLFFASLLLSLGLHQTGEITDILWLKIIGFVLIIPAVSLMAATMATITKGGLIEAGIMKIVRHPMYLGTIIASVALILIFQALLSLVLSATAIALLGMASKLEEDYNVEQFGDIYREYMSRVPRWNVFKGLRKG